jgi:hypothetical protein
VLEGEYVAEEDFPLPLTLPDLLPEEDSGPTPIPLIPITSRKEGASSSRTRSGSGGSRGARGTIPEVIPMITPVEALAEVINNPDITIDDRLKNLINSPTVGMDSTTGQIGRIEDGFGDSRNRAAIDAIQLSRQFERQNVLPGKKKRKVSKYQKEFGRQLKLLKKKHPRTSVTKLMKRAHSATRKALGMKRGTRKGQVRKTARRAFER